ncbi:LD-carboxypeptidase [Qipengyuania sp. XHP0207]|uniref:S66 peptidase family protein n=1 Tax=Qipengyuania sp. XHP0207 TaxID=3038078 RepID=UPI00241F08C6|nr:LD-carboxypeptidase [Qipengyuania sp. XHP0207]MDG5747770.1 LD-carboxypeptidase [Qipengyuania sp. XHP0207]
MIDRRAALGTMSGALLAASLPHPLAAATPRKAPRLRIGDTVGLVAPASALTLPWELDRAQHWISGMGLEPKLGRHVREQDGYLAGTDVQRAEDYMAMVADPQVRGIFAIRGGWGGARILPLLEWGMIRANPKLLIGYSDTTALHLAIAARAGFPTIHGPNAASRWERESWDSLWRLAFAADTPVLAGAAAEQASGRTGRTISSGTAQGRLLGGNLTILSTLMGTPYLPDFDRAVLFLEDVNEDVYRVDRMLQQLRLAGVLGKLAGVAFGQCTRCNPEENSEAGFTLDTVLDHHLGSLGIPAFAGANIGHVTNQQAMPHGVRVELDADARTIRLLEPVVS